MLLRRHASLGRLPAVVALAFLGATVMTLGTTILMVALRTPVLLVPDAEGISRLSPARADTGYQRAFASAFLQHWETWNATTCAQRRSVALAMLEPAVRSACAGVAGASSGLMQSLLQSQDLVLDTLQVQPSAAGQMLTEVSFHGELTQYFGGVGGDPDPWSGRMLMRSRCPCPEAPWCLEVLDVELHPGPLTSAPPGALQ